MEKLPERAIHLQTFEGDARFGEKRVHIQELLAKHGFPREEAEIR